MARMEANNSKCIKNKQNIYLKQFNETKLIFQMLFSDKGLQRRRKRAQPATTGAPFTMFTLVSSILFVIFSVTLTKISALRTGAPAIACINMRPLHGLNRPKPASASQFFIFQSALSYLPGQTIDVDITTHSNERYFRGFLIQAYDPSSGAHVGQFLASNDSKPISSCSAATHKNNLNKQNVRIVWSAPSHTHRGSHSSGESASGSGDSGSGASHGGSLVSAFSPTLSLSLIAKRQNVDMSPTNTTEAASSQPSSPGQASKANQLVRFRATIVVTYDEFYTGFESSDRYFDKFGYANGTTTETN